MTQYEYRQSPTNELVIQVRYKQAHAGRYTGWYLYLLADSVEQAEYVLNMLQYPQREEQVRE